jgi:Uma2 family endonuclease
MNILDTIIPPLITLENGDRLSRSKFEQRYSLLPASQKAELIEGVVYMAAALRYRRHGKPHSDIITWLGTYAANTPGIEPADNTTVRLDLENEPQPDALLRIEEHYGGQSRVSADDYIEGAPELIVEIAASKASYDLHDKLRAYRRNGVHEYLVWLVEEQELRWYILQNSEYALQESDEFGIMKSQIFPGLHLDVNALLRSNMSQVLATLRQGMSDGAYQDFVRDLQVINHRGIAQD